MRVFVPRSLARARVQIDKKLKSLVFSKVCNDLTLMAIPLVKVGYDEGQSVCVRV